MTANEIKKELYKQRPKAWLQYIRKGVASYLTTLQPDDGLDIWFDVPVSDMGDADFLCVMESQLLIRWLVQEKPDVPHSYDCDCLEHEQATAKGFTDSETTSRM